MKKTETAWWLVFIAAAVSLPAIAYVLSAVLPDYQFRDALLACMIGSNSFLFTEQVFGR